MTMESSLITPKIDKELAKKIVFELYGIKVKCIFELNGYDDKNFHVIPLKDHKCDNIHIKNVREEGYVLKVVNSLDSEDVGAFEGQNQLLAFLEFISGEILFHVKNLNESVFHQVGLLTAQMDKALQNFDHPAYRKTIQWCLGAAPDLVSYIEAIEQRRRPLVQNIISQFTSRVVKIEERFSKGIIHGDINEQNLIVTTKDDGEIVIKGIIDFGDTHYCCYLYELALAIMYMIFLSNNVDTGGYVLKGYLSARPITDEEFNLLYICVMARFCQSLVLGAYANMKNPANTYVLTTAQKGWKLLETLSSMSEETVLQQWKQITQNNDN
ncbi:hypothetical protein ABEB36_002906 [Hypothenemus hampei]|uniref:Hydroxylysine kinase n=1 Tax=Hypothenemus hampei TaxID=57062 RepID=A0ABD1FAI1_HYPHA